jgi:hypothetical protein
VDAKVCTGCNERKPLTEFSKDKTKSDGYQSSCKVCAKQYYQENKDRISKQHKQYRQENRGRRNEYLKQYYQENKDRRNERAKQYYQENKDRINERNKQYYQENKDRAREYHKQYKKQKRQTDPLYALKDNIRKSCGQALKGSKSKKTTDMLGCSFEQLYFHLHLERFENPSHDHIIPLSWGETVEEIEILAHYTNLQGMELEENASKGNYRCSVAKAHKVLKQHPNPDAIKTILNRKTINNGYYEND